MIKNSSQFCYYSKVFILWGILILPTAVLAQSLSYTVSWLGIPVVDVTIMVSERDTSIQAEYHAKTRSWFDSIYAVDNRYWIEVDPVTFSPRYYRKQILERGRADSLWVRYPPQVPQVTYSNGIERAWVNDTHTLFSALLWVQHYDWELDEELRLPIEVEGVLWEAGVECVDVIPSRKSGIQSVEVKARFERRVAGEPVLSTTDILTYILPGVGHRLNVALDPVEDEVKWIEFGAAPFVVRAELNSVTDQ
ncbi:MAG: DUF3108 domain-containing protein [Fidelibacterota bacterium]|nr:MAG: DUF3108 domain-containing protein [Candidatus Neomarinimicrobiota bacterium]